MKGHQILVLRCEIAHPCRIPAILFQHDSSKLPRGIPYSQANAPRHKPLPNWPPPKIWNDGLNAENKKNDEQAMEAFGYVHYRWDATPAPGRWVEVDDTPTTVAGADLLSKPGANVLDRLRPPLLFDRQPEEHDDEAETVKAATTWFASVPYVPRNAFYFEGRPFRKNPRDPATEDRLSMIWGACEEGFSAPDYERFLPGERPLPTFRGWKPAVKTPSPGDHKKLQRWPNRP